MKNHSETDTPPPPNSHLVAHRTDAALPATLHVSLWSWLDFYLLLPKSSLLQKKGFTDFTSISI